MGNTGQFRTRIGAVVLAGGRVPAPLEGLCAHRALLFVNGRYALEYLLDTLDCAPSVAGIALVAPAEALEKLAHLPGEKVAAGETLVENMARGAAALAATQPTHLVFITGDIPLLTVDGLESYVRASLASGAALTYPIIPRAISEARFPGAKRTYVRIREGTFTGGNAVFTTAGLLADKQGLIQELYSARKQPLRLAQILGFGTLLRLLTGTLTLPLLERVAGRILGAPVCAIVTEHAEIGFDIDKPQDLFAVEAAMKVQG